MRPLQLRAARSRRPGPHRGDSGRRRRAQPPARQLGGPVSLVQAIDPIAYYTALGAAPYTVYRPDLLDETADDARKELDAYATAWREDGISVNVRVSIGQSLDVIEQAVKDEQAGWVAMASHGRGGLGGLVLGSTALAVLHRASVPVLIVAGSASAPANEQRAR